MKPETAASCYRPQLDAQGVGSTLHARRRGEEEGVNPCWEEQSCHQGTEAVFCVTVAVVPEFQLVYVEMNSGCRHSCPDNVQIASRPLHGSPQPFCQGCFYSLRAKKRKSPLWAVAADSRVETLGSG